MARDSITCNGFFGWRKLSLHLFWTIALGSAAALWIYGAVTTALGLRTLESVADAPPLKDGDCPSVSILFAARDEAEKLPAALETFLAMDYPAYEIVAVNDRSQDDTEQILKSAAQNNPRLKAVSVKELPAGWLGKPHALQKAYEQSTGEWLIFTDADVQFAPSLLRSAVALANKKGCDHLTLSGRTDMFTFGEKIAMTFFGLAFLMSVRPWAVSDSNSGAFAGIGMFQLIRRSTYEAIGTHRRLAMEVVDDMKLGKLVKEEGFQSAVAVANNEVSVHWHSGVGNIIRGTTKNFFAFTGFSLWTVGVQIVRIIDDVRGAVDRVAIRSRARAIIRGDLRGAGHNFSRWRVYRIQGFAVVCADVPRRRTDFRLDAGALDNCYVVDRWNYLAWDVLSAEGAETRRCIGSAAPSADSFAILYL